VALHAWTSARYVIPLPSGHRFPIEKYARLRDRVVADGLISEERLHEPARASADDLRLVHTREYVESIERGTIDPGALRRIGFPWSPALVERSLRAVGGTCEAAAAALEAGIAVNLAGGTHHAFPGHGEGFCVFNDVAVAIRLLQRDGRIERAAVIDLDVHQGNGTHAIFAGDPTVFTFSIHGAHNYPFRTTPAGGTDAANGAAPSFGLRVAGDLDIDLPDGTGDAAYLELLADALPRVLAAAAPDLVVYLAGADPHEGDRLGRMRLTFSGLERRDAMVIGACREIGVPVAVTIAGGYGREIDDTVRVHLNTVRVAGSFS
jgi:acetoin utilization deacetylase AcuC-like enzyme